MIVLMASQKGGTSKSTVTCNLAAALSQHSADVLILDADRQNTASEWAQERKSAYPEFPAITCLQAYGDIESTLRDLDRRYQYTLVDVSGRDSEELRSTLMACAAVILPFRPSQPDLATLPTVSKIIQFSRRYNQNLKALALLSIAPTNPSIKEIQAAQACLSEYNDLLMLNTIIHDRKIYRDSMADGLGVIETTSRAESDVLARAEITALTQEILSHVSQSL